VELARLIGEERGAAVGVGLVVAAPALKFIHLDQLADLLSAGPDRPRLLGPPLGARPVALLDGRSRGQSRRYRLQLRNRLVHRGDPTPTVDQDTPGG
jgi:hypothetical protein